MNLTTLATTVEAGIKEGVKNIFLLAGCPPLGNKREIITLGDSILENEDIEGILRSTASEEQFWAFEAEKELDYSYALEGLGRFRMNAFQRMGSLGIVMRPIPARVPAFETLHLPPVLRDITKEVAGLVLVTGPTGSGKSTTMASLIDIINRERACHIVTIEDPIEFVFKPVKSVVSQREIGKDTRSFGNALKRLPREDPDVVLIGEIRDKETMKAAIQIAETGHLVFATLHTSNAFQTVNRVLDFFSEGERDQMRSQVSTTLKAIVSQRLLQRADGMGFVCACEFMKATRAVKNLILRNRIHEINSIMDISKKEGMISMDEALFDLYKDGLVDMEEAVSYSSKGAAFLEKLRTTPSKRPHVAEGRRPGPAAKGKATYRADFSMEQLGNFDASGMLSVDPAGLLFKDTDDTLGDTHFVADYSILNGRRDAFALGSLFHVSYKVLGFREEKKLYAFSLRIVAVKKEEAEVPVQLGLIRDEAWHTLDVPIPAVLHGKHVRYYMLLFDSAVTEIVFSDIHFM